MATAEPNLTDIVAAIRRTQQIPEYGAGFTVLELAGELHCPTDYASKQLRALLASGEAEIVRIRRQQVNGNWRTHNGFRLKG